MNSVVCEWCEEKKDTVLVFVEKGMDEYCSLCRPCAISYYKDMIADLKAEELILNMQKLEITDRDSPKSPYKSTKSITGTHCF